MMSMYPQPVIQHDSLKDNGNFLFGRQTKPVPSDRLAGRVNFNKARSLEKRFGLWYLG